MIVFDDLKYDWFKQVLVPLFRVGPHQLFLERLVLLCYVICSSDFAASYGDDLLFALIQIVSSNR